jgi:hypothetical protein
MPICNNAAIFWKGSGKRYFFGPVSRRFFLMISTRHSWICEEPELKAATDSVPFSGRVSGFRNLKTGSRKHPAHTGIKNG